MNIKYYEVKSGETDDVIASYTLRYKNHIKIVISSFDSDFFQLIDENVFVFRYKGENSYVCNVEYIKDKFGILPSQYADFKSLTGDKADNIKGADKVGNKTASSLICEFGTLEKVIENAESIKKPFVKNSIMSGADRLRLNQKLIKLCDNCVLPFGIDELEIETEKVKAFQTRDVLEKNNLL